MAEAEEREKRTITISDTTSGDKEASSSSRSPSLKSQKTNMSTLECFPISTLDTIQFIIDTPPSWATHVPPLQKRSSAVCQNVVSDCHSEESKYFPKTRLERHLVPRTLVCHDYKGGYREDRYFIAVKNGACYTFYNWAHIDIFVYFSHHLVTIPPFCWIKAAHQNGVKILGTFITEFDSGTKICKEILKDRPTVKNLAKQLAKIMEIFKFDGWLLNIENPVETGVEFLQDFVQLLTKYTHKINPEGLVIWYDSVLEDGQLKWQNKLTPENRCFFDRCDGIFLNYNWKEADLKKSIELAQYRYLDIYVGIDVFGRNTFYKEGFDVYKAAQMVRRYNMSMAIFAPGWTHESLQVLNQGDESTFLQQFIDRDYGFWSSLWPYLYTHPVTKQFFTTFYFGTDQNYFDMFNQELQLSRIKFPRSILSFTNDNMPNTLMHKCNCLQYDLIDKYTMCMINARQLPRNVTHIHHLFTCDLPLSGNVIIFYHTKQAEESSSTKLNFVLSARAKNGAFNKIVLNGKTEESLKQDRSVIEVNPCLDRRLIGEINKQYYYTWSSDGTWQLNVYKFSVDNMNLLEIGAMLVDGMSVYLCSFGFYNPP